MKDDENTNWSKLSFGVALGWLAAYQYFKLPPVLPLLLDRYAYDPLLAGSLMSVFALTGLLLSAWVGKRQQRIGILPLLITACVLFVGGSMMALVWPQSSLLMLVARSGEALGYAILAVVGVITAVSAAAARDRPLAIGLWATWIPAGQILAALTAALLAGQDDWRMLWHLGLVFTLGMAVWGWRLSRSGALAASGGGQQAAAPTQRTSGGRGMVLASAAMFALWSGQFIAYMTWLPQFMVDTHGLDMTETASGYALVPAMIIVFNLVAAALLKRGVGVGRLMSGALCIQAALWFLMPHSTGLITGIAALAAYGMASGVVPTCMFSLPHLLAPSQQEQAHAYGVLMAGRNLGALLGPVLLPQVRAVSGGWEAVMPVFGVVTGGALLLCLYVFRCLRRASNR